MLRVDHREDLSTPPCQTSKTFSLVLRDDLLCPSLGFSEGRVKVF